MPLLPPNSAAGGVCRRFAAGEAAGSLFFAGAGYGDSFLYEADFQHSFGKTVKMIREKTNRIALVIGPESGFSSSEAENIIALKGHPVTMGKRILPPEKTAGPTALSALMFACGEWEVLNEN